jgi:hypothetical protein
LNWSSVSEPSQREPVIGLDVPYHQGSQSRDTPQPVSCLTKLLLSRRGDLLSERRNADGTEKNVVADDIAGGAADAEGARKLPALFEHRIHLRPRGFRFEPRAIEAKLGGYRQRPRLVGATGPASSLL